MGNVTKGVRTMHNFETAHPKEMRQLQEVSDSFEKSVEGVDEKSTKYKIQQAQKNKLIQEITSKVLNPKRGIEDSYDLISAVYDGNSVAITPKIKSIISKNVVDLFKAGLIADEPVTQQCVVCGEDIIDEVGIRDIRDGSSTCTHLHCVGPKYDICKNTNIFITIKQ